LRILFALIYYDYSFFFIFLNQNQALEKDHHECFVILSEVTTNECANLSVRKQKKFIISSTEGTQRLLTISA
jgi:hypothetical protein